MIRIFKRQENKFQFAMENKLKFVEINLLYSLSKIEYQFLVKPIEKENMFVEHSHGEIKII